MELPVFFYIDPEFVNDPKMETVSSISLSYTFFESKEMPGFNLLNLGNWSPHGKGRTSPAVASSSPPGSANISTSSTDFSAKSSAS